MAGVAVARPISVATTEAKEYELIRDGVVFIETPRCGGLACTCATSLPESKKHIPFGKLIFTSVQVK
jgi:hypothetical protein